MENDNKKYFNVSLLGNLDSGKCSLARTLNIATNCISVPNMFKVGNDCFNILPFPCHPRLEYEEKYDICTSMGELAIILFSEEFFGEKKTSLVQKYKEEVLKLAHKGIKHIVFCLNKIDSFQLDEEQFLSFTNELNMDGLLKIYSDCFLSRPDIYYVPISAKECFNISENINLDVKSSWYKGLSLFDTLRIISSKLRTVAEELEGREARFLIYDSYRDEDYFVISGKLLEGKIFFNQEYQLCPLGRKVTIEKICDCQGIYVTEISPFSFSSVNSF